MDSKPDFKTLQRASDAYLKQRKYSFISTPVRKEDQGKVGRTFYRAEPKVKGKSARRAMKKARRLEREQNNG